MEYTIKAASNGSASEYNFTVSDGTRRVAFTNAGVRISDWKPEKSVSGYVFSLTFLGFLLGLVVAGFIWAVVQHLG